METAVIERDDTPEVIPTPAPESTPTPESDASPEKEAKEPADSTEPETTPEVPANDEPSFEVDGEKLTPTQIREWRKKYDRDTKWVQANEERSAQLKRDETEISALRALKPYLDQRPDVLQQLFTPKPERNFDTEIQQLYQYRPLDTGSQEYVNWDYQVRNLYAEKAEARASHAAEEKYATQTAQQSNSVIERAAWTAYKEKVSQEDFVKMADYIKGNIRQGQFGAYPENCFDIAYRSLFWDKELERTRLETAQKAAKTISNAKPANPIQGVNKPRVELTEDDEADERYVQLMKERRLRKTTLE
jgi:hypothetical protein